MNFVRVIRLNVCFRLFMALCSSGVSTSALAYWESVIGGLVNALILNPSKDPHACSGSDVAAWNACNGEIKTDKGTYKGTFYVGKPHGHGVFLYANGAKYEGYFWEGELSGAGVFSAPDGFVYEGLFLRGKFNGRGTAIEANGNKYVGEFRDGERHGQGTYYFVADNQSKGDKYVGEHRAGNFHGQGTYTYANGSKYVGEFRDSKRHGQGAETVANGNGYVGEWRDGKPNGQGTYSFANGAKYVGEFRDGAYNGQGILSFADQRPSMEGFWQDNEFVRAERISGHIVGKTSSRPPPVAQTPRQAEPPGSSLSLSVSPTQPDPSGVVTLTIVTNSDTASLKINGDEAGGRADGRYTVKRFAQVGDNNFEVIATDRFGNTQRKIVTVSRAVEEIAARVQPLNPIRVSESKPRDAVAIIIGIEKYKSVGLASFADRDARVFYDYARRALGVRAENIKLLVDEKADAAEILVTFKNWLPARVKRGSTDVYVFYSGHGLPSEDGSSLYLLPHEARTDLLERTAVSQSELVAAIQKTSPKSVTMFLDSCYSGQSRTGETLLASARPISVKAKQSIFPKNFTVISASAPDQYSYSSLDLRHGIFSYYLMRGMEGEADTNKDKQITVAEIHAYLSENVMRRAMGMNRMQQPQVVGDHNRVLVGR